MGMSVSLAAQGFIVRASSVVISCFPGKCIGLREADQNCRTVHNSYISPRPRQCSVKSFTVSSAIEI